MWINFSCRDPFAVKIYIGGVNAVSGEPASETISTMLRRLKLLNEGKNIQDYVVPPKQLWLDGIAHADGTVRQFVATQLGSGYSVEAQITGEEIVGGLQIEVVPCKVSPRDLVPPYKPPHTIKARPRFAPKPTKREAFQIFVSLLTGRTITLQATNMDTVHDIQKLIQQREEIPVDQQRLVYGGMQLEEGMC